MSKCQCYTKTVKSDSVASFTNTGGAWWYSIHNASSTVAPQRMRTSHISIFKEHLQHFADIIKLIATLN